jgi:hypothetical protein
MKKLHYLKQNDDGKWWEVITINNEVVDVIVHEHLPDMSNMKLIYEQIMN